MKLNPDKCRVIHYKANRIQNRDNRTYYICNSDKTKTKILPSVMERDLGVMVTSDSKWKNQTQLAINKARASLGRIRNSFKYFDHNIVKIIYPTFVRPHIEYGVQVWNPQTKIEIKNLEKLQKKSIDLATDLKNLSYEEKLDKLELTTHKLRRKRGDFIQIFKKIKNFEKINFLKNVETINRVNLRGHSLRIHRETDTKHIARTNFITNRIPTEWNSLPAQVVESDSVNEFKNKFDKYIKTNKHRQSIYC